MHNESYIWAVAMANIFLHELWQSQLFVSSITKMTDTYILIDSINTLGLQLANISLTFVKYSYVLYILKRILYTIKIISLGGQIMNLLPTL